MTQNAFQVTPESAPGYRELFTQYWKQAWSIISKWLIVFIVSLIMLYLSKKVNSYYVLTRWTVIAEIAFLATYVVYKTIISPFSIMSSRKELIDSETRRVSNQQGILSDLLEETQGIGGLMDLLHKNLVEKIQTAEQNYSVEYYSPFWDNVDDMLVSFSLISQCLSRLSINEDVYKRLLLHKAHTFDEYPRPTYDKTGINKIIYRFETLISTAERNEKFATIKDQRHANLNINAGLNSIASVLIKMKPSIQTLTEQLKLEVSARMDVTYENRKELLGNLAQM
ncbi:MAG: hypothetical protein HOJ19_02345 [Candidatus Marinimicrobia bacterium]|jgi:hypothetical protein|nr:hypothetical protein [Candidatus Neomarinimicrobiota bacterium]MBT3577021.1 hypothetical protein [Candidatus Neomarinimicrobiota bacterium]MBT3679903.1 hypothetical protein [Candidatus Neomarinimicrobiota bacterium]MBT3949702.1 hypothetical protein [Candidatus Neomarinimicrobiota bacterium]MBT4253147.1 hypothetical protein [Candidatus Neomarinimicrobiota bacterium]